MIQQLIQVQKQIVPDMLDTLRHRYDILHYVRLMQPIGRRTLAVSLGLTERILRREVDFLKDQGLLMVATQGISLTESGRNVLRDLHEVMGEILGISEVARELERKLGVRQVVIVPGDSDETFWVQRDIGRAAVTQLKARLAPDDNIIAVTGGTTMASVAAMMSPDKKERPMHFVPARGGLGETLELQANTVCSRMADRAHADYHLLHIPDEVSQETFERMVEEPSIKNVLEMIRAARIVVHGIGEAETMAKRRHASPEHLRMIERHDAVAEAFGYYFNAEGEIVHRVKTVGIQLEELDNMDTVIAVAGGKSKAQAIAAYAKHTPNIILVTDEGAATELLNRY